jgi:hypothetical protein
MIGDYDEADSKVIEAKRAALAEEQKRLMRLKRVFGSGDGLDVLEWLLNVSGYWASELRDERAIGRFELGRFVFNQVSLADIDIAHSMLDRRRKPAEALRQAELKKLDVKEQ